jgi:GT2 family glycosyltransferase/glycosyltransferase involved in cell wall biosynthesis
MTASVVHQDAKFNPLNHPICFTSLKRLPTSAWLEHVPFALFLIDVLRPRLLVELGTHGSCSYAAFCQAVKERDLPTRCYAVYPPAKDGRSTHEVGAELQGQDDPLYGGFSCFIQATFEDALGHFDDGSIDLLHIDGLRSYEAVRNVIESWLPKLTSHGIVLLHQTNVREADFGVCKLWEEIRDRYPAFEFFHGRGLGVLAVGEVPWTELQELFAAVEVEAARIRKFFFQLASHLSLKLARDTWETKIQSLQNDLVAQVQAQAPLQSQVTEKEQELARLQGQVLAQEQTLRLFNDRQFDLESGANCLRADVADREEKLSQLKARLETEVADREEKLSQLKARLGTEIADRAEKLSRLEAKLAEKEQTLARLRALVDKTEQDSRQLQMELQERGQAHARLEAQLAEQEQLIQTLNKEATENEEWTFQLEISVVRKDQKINTLAGQTRDSELANRQLQTRVAEQEHALGVLTAQLADITTSNAWRLSQLMRRLRARFAPPGTFRERWLRLGIRGARMWKREGFGVFVRKGAGKLAARLPGLARSTAPPAAPPPVPPVSVPATPGRTGPYVPPPAADAYEVWQANNAWTDRAARVAECSLELLARRPLFSVIMPVHDADELCLRRAVDSVRVQVYPHWELCIADDASRAAHVRPLLNRLAAEDPRIRVCFLAENGNISQATNAAAELARGQYLVLLDQDDEITADCLFELAQAAATEPAPDMIYSDDDKIDVAGRRYAPQFKPDWSPELLLSYSCFSHVLCLKRSLYAAVGGLRTGLEGCQDYDLALRVSERAERVVHLPKVLYHWRCLPGSTASNGAAKPAAFERGIRAVQDALDRRGIKGRVSRPDWAVNGHLGIFQIDFPDDGPKVSILIPTKDRLDLLRPCLESIRRKTTYRNYEIVVIDNDSSDGETRAYLEEIRGWCKVVHVAGPGGSFNFAYLNNEAAKQADGEFLLLLNNDTEVLRPEWLSQLVGYGQIRGVGVAGGRLLYPDGRVQHAGVVRGYHHGIAGHAFKLLPQWDPGYLFYAKVARNYSAATAACLLVRRELYAEMGGLDERQFAVAFNDVDFCLRVGRRGLRCVYVPRAELIHKEGASRGFADNPTEQARFRRLWGSRHDPYYSPNLSLEHERFALDTRHTRRQPIPSELPVRLLMCAHNLDPEGAPFSQYELTLRLKERGRLAPEVYAPTDGPLAQLYRAAGIPVHVFSNPLKDVHTRELFEEHQQAFAQWIRDEGYHLLYANTLSSFFAIDAAQRLGLPSLWNIRESIDWRSHFEQFGSALVEPALRCFQYPYRIVFVAEATRRLFGDLNSRHNFAVIHNGLRREPIDHFIRGHSPQDAKAQIGCPLGKMVVSIIGTVCERKGQHEFVQAALEVLRRGQRDVVFYIVGCRPTAYFERLKDLVAPYANHIRLIPETEHIHPYFRASDVLVCCSTNESFPRVILEAMAFGLPLITTLVYGIAEQVTHERSALTYTPGDVDQLRAHLERLLTNPSERERLGAGARATLDTLTSYEEMVEAYEQFLLEAYLTAGEPAQTLALGEAFLPLAA